MKRGIFLIILILLIIGCSNTRTNEPRENWRTGTQGLQVTMLPNLPPARLYDDQPVEVVLDLANKGATEVGSSSDRIYLSGFDQNIITGIPTNGQIIPLIEGKTEFGPGGVGTLSFKGTIRALGFRNVDKYTPRLLVTTCYGYETVGSDNVCVDPDPYTSARTEKVCTPSSVSMGGSQGAPVSIGPVQVEASPGRTRFTISVTNVGGGDVFKPGANYLNKCSPYADEGLQYTDADAVQVVDVSVAGVSMRPSCKPLDNGFLRLNSGRGTIYCEFSNIQGSSAYTTPLTVTLAYGYRQSLTRDLTILRVT